MPCETCAAGRPLVVFDDNKIDDSPHVHFTPEQWEAILPRLKRGDADFLLQPTTAAAEGIDPIVDSDGVPHMVLWKMTNEQGDGPLYYYASERDGFLKAVREGYFDIKTPATGTVAG